MSKGKGAKQPAGNRARAKAQKRGPSTTLIALVAVAAVIVVGGAILLNAMRSPAAPPPVAGLIADANTKGPADAKVTVVEYSDFQ